MLGVFLASKEIENILLLIYGKPKNDMTYVVYIKFLLKIFTNDFEKINTAQTVLDSAHLGMSENDIIYF